MFSGQQPDQTYRLTQIDSAPNKIMFARKISLGDRQIINSTILCVVKKDLCYICLMRRGFVENPYCVQLRYWLSEIVLKAKVCASEQLRLSCTHCPALTHCIIVLYGVKTISSTMILMIKVTSSSFYSFYITVTFVSLGSAGTPQAILRCQVCCCSNCRVILLYPPILKVCTDLT